MLDDSVFSQQTGGSVVTSNPQSIPASNLQPQQTGLQMTGSQVLGSSTLLEQSSGLAISVNGQEINQEISDLQTSQEQPSNVVGTAVSGREVWIIGGIILVVGVLIYVLAKQITQEQHDR